MSYQVFARKYRPQTFADVLGQDHVVRTLSNAIAQNRLAHAYLFVGPRGTGKTSTARIFAKALNCPNGPSIEFDPNDDVCREIAEGRSLDVLEIDGASHTGVDQVRDLRESVSYAPARCRFKIYYIDEVHMLSSAAFNALLKTLEEPPAHVKFIFATTEAHKILPTIISRCQRFDLRRIPQGLIAKHLLHIAGLEGVELEERAAYAVAKGADGGMRDAQSMLDQLVSFCGNRIVEADVLSVFGFTSAAQVAGLMQALLEQNTVAALQIVDQTSESGKDLGKLLSDLIEYVRALLVAQCDFAAASQDLEPELARSMQQQAGMVSTEKLLRLVDGLAEVDARMRWSSNKRLHLELGMIQAVQQLQEVSLSEVMDVLSGGEMPAASQGGALRARPITAGTQVRDSKAASVAVAVEPPPAEQPKPRAVEQAIEPTAQPMQAAEPVARAEPSVVSQSEPVASAAPREPAAAEPAPAAAATVFTGSLQELWMEALRQAQQTRPLILTWMQVATAQSLERGILRVGFPSSESASLNSLQRDSQKKFLEDLLGQLTGSSIKLDLRIDASLPEPLASDLGIDLFGGGAEPGPAATDVDVPSPAAVEPVASAAPPASGPAQQPAAAMAAAAEAGEQAAQDPLIKQAVERFRLKLMERQG